MAKRGIVHTHARVRTARPPISLKIILLIAAAAVVGFLLLQMLQNDNSNQVKGISTTTITHSDVQPIPPVGNRVLTCRSCAEGNTSSTPSICLNSTGTGGNGIPYAHCASGPVSGETCVTCPQITPFPTIVPPPPGCHYVRHMCPMMGIACRQGQPCPTCSPEPTIVCDGTPIPSVTGTSCTPKKYCPPTILCKLFGYCDCKDISVCPTPEATPVITFTPSQ